MTRGECSENLTLPILYSHLPSDHYFHLYSFVGLRLIKNKRGFWGLTLQACKSLNEGIRNVYQKPLSFSTYIISKFVNNVKFFSNFFYLFFDTQHLVNTIGHNGQRFPCWFFGKLSLDISPNLLTQQVHRSYTEQTVGAGPLSLFKKDTHSFNLHL